MTDRNPRHIVITDRSHGLPYSKGLMASSLMTSGLPAAEAYRIAERIEETLHASGVKEVTSETLRDLAADLLKEVGDWYADNYLKWQAVEDLEMPLVVLIGGATGVGKSTVATQLAARLGITRVISTDAVREVLRSAFSRELMPSLHESSFQADAALRTPIPEGSDRLVIGFQEQVAAVSVGVKALIARAIEEGTDMIVEGAHLVPGFLDGWEEEFKDAVLVPIVMVVQDEGLHRSHFHMRALETRSARHDLYLEGFDKIRAIQRHVQKLAEERDVPIIDAFDIDSTVQQTVSLVVEKGLSRITAEDTSRRKPAAAMGKGRQGRLRSWEVVTGRRRS